MKKYLAFVCMITCLLGLTACTGEEKYSEYQQEKIEFAKNIAVNQYLPLMQGYSSEDIIADLREITPQEREYGFNLDIDNTFTNSTGSVPPVGFFEVDGNALLSGAISFHSGLEVIGEITSIGEVTADVDNKDIIVAIEVIGMNKNAVAQIIVSNDMFLNLKSASLNPVASFGESMQNAGLNTLIGMGSVFVVLILISGIISCFSLIPKLQAKKAKKETEKNAAKMAPVAESTGVDKAVAQIVKQETVVNLVNDLELVAVIAAAIAASEGATSTDGFVVRSIVRRKVF